MTETTTLPLAEIHRDILLGRLRHMLEAGEDAISQMAELRRELRRARLQRADAVDALRIAVGLLRQVNGTPNIGPVGISIGRALGELVDTLRRVGGPGAVDGLETDG